MFYVGKDEYACSTIILASTIADVRNPENKYIDFIIVYHSMSPKWFNKFEKLNFVLKKLINNQKEAVGIIKIVD